MLGRTLSHYTILEKLGGGGMGDVYLADDAALGRKVALKVLPPAFAENEERRARFTREAKAVAALNHPNIVTIHSVEEADGVHFITMELVRGKTIGELLPRSGWPLNRFFEVAIPLADAIAAAHHVGITHRDLKPDNVMVTDDGRVKVLDFGLAKLQGFANAGAADLLPTQTATQEGHIVGTLAYMSPEQAEGRPLDARSDLFSLGVLFYEMLTGQRPFRGETPSSLLSSILRDTPKPARALNPTIPRDLEKIVSRCLAKDVSHRIQTALDVRNQVEEVKGDFASGEIEDSGGSLSAERINVNLWIAGGMLILLLGIGGAIVYVVSSREGVVPQFDNPVQLTTAAGEEGYPTWSPDGARLAFESNQSGNWDIWVTQIRGGATVNLTADHKGDDRLPSWSPDGGDIAFFSSREGAGLFVMPALGGPARKILSAPQGLVPAASYYSAPQWSGDGSQVAAAFRSAEVTAVTRFSFASQKTITTTFPGRCLDMSWSPDERFFACAEGQPFWEVNRLWIVPAAGGERVLETGYDSKHASPSWSADGRSLFFVSNRGGIMDLWRQLIDRNGRPSGDAQRVTTALGAQSARFSPRSDKLAFSRGQIIGNIWRFPILRDRIATWSDAAPVTSEQARIAHVDVSPDGQRLVFSSTRSGSPDLWLMSTSGGEMKRLTTDLGEERGPQFSSDGKQIAFHSARSGNRDIWVMPAEGGPARTLAPHPATDWFPTWSPDDEEIAFISDRGDRGTDIWVVPSLGGEARGLTDHPAQDEWPVYSPDGQSIIFRSTRTAASLLYRVPRTGGDVEPVTKGAGSVATWAPDRRTLYFQGVANRDNSLWALAIDGAREFQVADLSGRQGNIDGSSLATDGRYLYFIWTEGQSDLWVMDVIRR